MAQVVQQLYQLKGVVQHYSWGGYEFIPGLLQIKNEKEQPFAEYWMGAHPNHSSTIQAGGEWISLHDYIRRHTTEVLGEKTAHQFNSLPYLFKILDVRQMLSIQVHPDKTSAKINFEKENAAGIPVTASHRNYKDDNHKPELMVALSDFWLLHGFKSPEALKEVLSAIPDFDFLRTAFEEGGYKALYERIMLMEQPEVNKILQPIAKRILPLYLNGELKKNREDFWAARAVQTFCSEEHYDRGIFSIYLFNLVNLKRGEGIYQPAQLPHAYLEGQNVELMANSDNVLRAGLTDKYVDVPELMKYVKFEPTIPNILGSGKQGKEVFFQPPAPEFEITHYSLTTGDQVQYGTNSAEIILVLSGELEITAASEHLRLGQGQAAFISAGTAVVFQSQSATDCFRAAVPA